MSQPKVQVGSRVQDARKVRGIGTVVSVGPEPYFDCEVRWEEPFVMDGEELYLEPNPQDELVLVPESTQA